MPDLARIAESSGLPPRKLRYVLDHGLLPGGASKSRGRGTTRAFTHYESFGLVVAATMLEAGLRRALVRDCMAVLGEMRGVALGDVPLYRAFITRSPTELEVGDWSSARVVVAPVPYREAFDSGWLPLGGGRPPPAGYAPLVTLVLDVAQLRGKVDRSD